MKNKSIEKIALRSEIDATFTDISSEMWREYTFPEGKVLLESPAWLNVSKSGGHRILDSVGVCHYIPPTWIHLRWAANIGQPHFVK